MVRFTPGMVACTVYVKRDEWRWVELWFVGIKMMADAFSWNLVKMCRKISSN